MSSLSVVVPRLGSSEHFEATLASILRYRMPHHQVVVIQSDLQADTYGLENEVDFVELTGRPSLAKYLNQIANVARNEIVGVIRPGVEVTNHWFVEGIRQLKNPRIGSVACSLVSASYRDEVISRGLTTNRRMLPRHATDPRHRPLGPCSWAGIYRRDVLVALGKLDETISDGFAALDLGFSIRSLGLDCEVMTDRVMTIADPALLKLQLRRQSGRDAQRMVQRHMARESQKIGSFVAIGSDFVSSFWRPSRWAHVAGRFAARTRQATDRGFSRRLALARQELESVQAMPAITITSGRNAA